jgi:Tol biopolymer transport system component
MKRCPECRRDYYDETLLYCLDDGTALLEGPATADRDEPMTAHMQSPATPSHRGSEAATRSLDGDLISKEIMGHKVRWAVVGVVGLVVLTGFGYGLFKFLNRSSVQTSVHSSADVITQRLTGDGRTRMPTISPDGKFLVYIKLDEGKESLWIKQIGTGSNVNVVKPGEATGFNGIAFSPDGNFVYFNANMGQTDKPTVYRVPTLGGTPTKYLSDGLFLRFSPDGKFISFRRAYPSEVKESVFVANADGSNEREMASRQGRKFFASEAAWSPDGTRLAVSVGDDELGATNFMSLATISVADGNMQAVGSKKWDILEDVVWHPSGDSLIVTASENSLPAAQLWEISYPSGLSRKLTNDLNGHFGVSVTADGKSIVSGERYARSAVWVSPDLKPENAKQVMPSTGDTWGLSWTPDGRIVYVSDQTGDAEVWIMNADGTEARSLTNDRIFKAVPTVSPDGKFVVYTSSANGGQLVRIDIAGGNPLVLTKATGADNAHISRDSRWVIYSAFVDGLPKVLRVPIDGGEEHLVTDYHAMEPRYSNDGSQFACFMLDEKTLNWTKLAVVPAEGGPPVVVFDTPTETNSSRGPVWMPGDKAINVIVAPGEKQNLWLQPLDGGSAHAMTDFNSPGIARRDYSRDGKRIAVVRAEGIANAIMITGFR